VFDLAALDRELTGSIFAGKLFFSSVVDSTNSKALAAARSGVPHGSVFFADEQTAGRGRGDHAWQSTAGEGLYVSVLLRPVFSSRLLPLLSLAVGLAAAEAIHDASRLTADLRWPNDLLLGPRKVGGILVEAKTEGTTVAYAVAGIGINVHQNAFAPDMSTLPTSLDLEAGQRVSRQLLLVSLLKSLEREALALADPTAPEKLPKRVAASSSWIAGRAVEVHGPQACRGVTDGLDSNGFLRVKTAEGLVIVQTGGIRAGEIE
jgi:BirA family biotin operon repressor/biotin-[acetyl-CoA-carboxylase] ligase